MLRSRSGIACRSALIIWFWQPGHSTTAMVNSSTLSKASTRSSSSAPTSFRTSMMRSPSGGLVDAIVCLLCHDRLRDRPRSPQGPSTEARQAVSLNGITVLVPRRLAHASISVPAIAANPREGSRLLWFWLKSQTATPKSAQLASRAPACGTQVRIGRRSNGATCPARRSRHSPKSSKLADVEAKRRPVAASSKTISPLLSSM